MKEKVAWSKYYGYKNLEKQILVTENTIFQIASVSKTITAAAVMQFVG
jgi:CubicO group peptidase (beta-lactamase class C family)